MMGLNWQYDFSRDFQFGGSLLHLSEQPLTSKVALGSEPLNNTPLGAEHGMETAKSVAH